MLGEERQGGAGHGVGINGLRAPRQVRGNGISGVRHIPIMAH